MVGALWNDADTGQRVVLGLIGAQLVFVIVVVVGNIAASGGNVATAVIVAVAAVTAVGLQAYFAKRVLVDWREMSGAGRWGTALAALVVPLAAGFVAPLVLVVALVVWFRSGLPVGGLGWTGAGPTRAAPGHGADLGTWWGGERVIRDDAGLPAWIGTEPVINGADGRPAWVGDRQVTYGAGGRMAWVGDDQVIHGADGHTPTWIGDRRVTP